MEFDGDGDYIEFDAGSQNFLFDQGDFSIVLWFKMNGNNSPQHADLISKRGNLDADPGEFRRPQYRIGFFADALSELPSTSSEVTGFIQPDHDQGVAQNYNSSVSQVLGNGWNNSGWHLVILTCDNDGETVLFLDQETPVSDINN